ncbi:ATP-binding protein [Caulobacter sp. RL271]|jgi:signal transduction histidine kinase/ActR/RegA family two-component response regulator|uniref:histidine kinase n=1 Tax=Caulobacter segnis TaxID=88688 RepID=A0ABY4ZU35_9CAUL|nr:ATP-binding protein [Caulobacter segnis]USQ96139.1 ATP-binding protein [Caulobacter segnis]
MIGTEEQKDVALAAASRRANTYLRIGATLAIALLLQIYMHPAWGWLWALTYVLCYAFEAWVKHGPRDPAASAPRWRRVVAFAAPFVTSVAFGALSVPLFASHVRFAPTLGGMLLAGALLNVVVTNAGSRSATLMAAAPHAFYLLIAPFIAKAANPGANLADVLWFGALLMIISVAVASRTLTTALKAEADAKAEAERRRHEAEEAVAAKSAFVAMISHELRTPISAILAGAARLHSEVPEASSKIHAQLIADAGDLMRALLNDLLDFSRLEAGRMNVEQAPFNLRQALSDTLRLWRPEIARKGLKLKVHGAATLPRWVNGDVTRLKQVLNNLLSNAIKFTERGEITVVLNAEPTPERVLLSIEVIDTGPGIPDALLGRLFTPFDQLHAAVVRHHGGSGLGLAISRELARLMGGDLTAARPPKQGAVAQGAHFTLTATLGLAEAPRVEEPGLSIAGLRVLVVDDHVVNRRAIELVLQPFGVEATLAESGEEALELLASEAFDAVLMDVYMPGMDGREATRRLRAGAGPNRDVPVIAVTASATPKDWDACAAAGMNGHVAKPIDPMELFGALAQALGGGASAATPDGAAA